LLYGRIFAIRARHGGSLQNVVRTMKNIMPEMAVTILPLTLFD
jgi:hypothetical protein